MTEVALTGGFRRPWIVWDTDTNVVTLDDQRVPCTVIQCSLSEGSTHDEPCWEPLTPGKLVGFTMGFHLENGLVAISCVDNRSSSLWLSPDFEHGGALLRTPTGVRVDPECKGYWCEGCYHNVVAEMTPYETYEELMALLKEWSSWTVDKSC